MSRIPVLGALVAAFALVLALMPGAAHAASATGKDPKGDAPAAIDMVSLKVNNGQKTIKATLKIKRLGTKGAFSVSWNSADLSQSYGISARKKKGKTKVAVVKVDPFEGTRKQIKCKGAKAAWNSKKNFIAFTVPQKCSGSAPDSWMFAAAAALSKTKYDAFDAPITVARG